VKPVTKQTFGRASPEAVREAAPRAVPNGALYRVYRFERASRDSRAAHSVSLASIRIELTWWIVFTG